MINKTKICENCKTGKEMYELDNHIPMCPYMLSWKNNKCNFYKPLSAKKDSLINRILKKLNII